jgi:uncharacterized membrane protein YqgA involved in biofilm formation
LITAIAVGVSKTVVLPSFAEMIPVLLFLFYGCVIIGAVIGAVMGIYDGMKSAVDAGQRENSAFVAAVLMVPHAGFTGVCGTVVGAFLGGTCLVWGPIYLGLLYFEVV